MAELQPIPFATQSYNGRSSRMGAELLQNLYVEAVPEGRISTVALIGTPGLARKLTFGTVGMRGMHQFGAYLYCVCGQKLYRVDSSYNQKEVGDIPGSGHVYMASNATHIAIITNAGAFAAKATEILEIPDPITGGTAALTGAAYQDGYGIFCRPNTEDFYISGSDDMTSIAALDFSNADTFADKLVTCISDHRELWLFGESTIEVWHNVGDPNFPFQRSGSGFMERGCAAPGSVQKANNQIYWLGDDLQVYVASSYQPQVISTPAVHKAIEAENSKDTATAFIYTQEGHQFYVLTFGTTTLVYDITTGRWHNRLSFNETRWRAQEHVWIWGKNLVGDFENGNLYELDLDVYTENGTTVQRRAVSPPLHAGGNRVLMDEIRVEMETGVGLTLGQGSDPQVMLDWSDDGGRTWSNQLWRTAGAIGEYRHQARWYSLGMFRERSIRVTISDPVKVAIMGIFGRLEPLSE